MNKSLNIHWLKYGLLLLVGLLAFSCKSKEDDNSEKPDNGNGGGESTTVDTTNTKKIVVIAFSYHDTNLNREMAAYTINDSLVVLPVQSSSGNVYANDICIDGSDIYVAGSDGADAVYWKNGEVNYLPEGTAASGICVKNGNVYISGYVSDGGDKARCWINGIGYDLTPGTRAQDICADENGNVFATGYYYNTSTEIDMLRYWQGTAATGMQSYTISPDKSGNSCEGVSVCLDETHYKDNLPFLCIAGIEYDQSGLINKQWVNRKMTKLDQASGNQVYDICAVDGKCYTCGNSSKTAKYWVSTIASTGAGTNLSAVSLSDGSQLTDPTGIAVFEDDVYVVGYRPKDFYPYFWVNGVQKTSFNTAVAGLQQVEPCGVAVARIKLQ